MRIGVAMSGGVDSTAGALLLREQGHEIIGLHVGMHKYSSGSWADVQQIAHRTEIPTRFVDLRSDFEEIVISHFVSEYAKGRTPSPCLVCNKFIKLGLLREHALTLGCDMLATGHYARVIPTANGPTLLKGVDPKKDQSYFLAMVPRASLSTLILPLGTVSKTQAREILKKRGIFIPPSAESQELCFIRGQTYRQYLLEHSVIPEPGPIIDVHGRSLGRHQGIVGFTVGQRRGMKISAPYPLYVVSIDPRTHTVVVGPVEHTFVEAVEVEEFNSLRERPVEAGETFWVKVRSTSAPTLSRVVSIMGSVLRLQFNKPQRGVASGQAAVLYSQDQVIGGGWIRETVRITASE